MSELGRREEALAPAEEAVTVYRHLAEANPAAYLSDLAMALWGYASVCVTIGLKLPAALVALQQAINIYQPLAEQLPEVFGANLWSAFHTLADVLDALGHSDEAAELRRQLDEAVEDQDSEESGSA